MKRSEKTMFRLYHFCVKRYSLTDSAYLFYNDKRYGNFNKFKARYYRIASRIWLRLMLKAGEFYDWMVDEKFYVKDCRLYQRKESHPHLRKILIKILNFK